jgi:hypothetical protein
MGWLTRLSLLMICRSDPALLEGEKRICRTNPDRDSFWQRIWSTAKLASSAHRRAVSRQRLSAIVCRSWRSSTPESVLLDLNLPLAT